MFEANVVRLNPRIVDREHHTLNHQHHSHDLKALARILRAPHSSGDMHLMMFKSFDSTDLTVSGTAGGRHFLQSSIYEMRLGLQSGLICATTMWMRSTKTHRLRTSLPLVCLCC
jgi:hypothetical protein